MKKFTLLLIIIPFAVACSSVIEKPINAEDFDEVKRHITSNEDYSEMKKKYVIDNLSLLMGFSEIGKVINSKLSDKIPSFREMIDEYAVEYDSIKAAKLKIAEDNEKLKNFIELVDAGTIGISEYKGYLNMKLKLNNQFDKGILYTIINYRYVDKYDTEFFNEKSKLTDEVAGDFKGEVEISTKGEYDNIASFIWNEVPVKAKKELRNQLGEQAANAKVQRDFLMDGLQVKTLGIVFEDKTEITYQNAEWEYIE